MLPTPSFLLQYRITMQYCVMSYIVILSLILVREKYLHMLVLLKY